MLALNHAERFFLHAEPGQREDLLRRLVGLLTLWWAASWFTDARAVLSRNSLFPAPGRGPLSWSVLPVSSPTVLIYVVLGAALAAGVLLVVGRWPRLATVVAFVAMVSVQRAQPAALNAGDQLLRLLLLWMVVGIVVGTQSTLSSGIGPRPKTIVRLFQIQIIVVYATAAIWKLQGAPWRDGSAVFYALTDASVAWLPLPFATTTPAVWKTLTYLTVGVEAALPVLLMVSRTRLFAIGVGIVLHLVFAYALRVGIFTPAMLVGLCAFLPVDVVRSIRRTP